MYFNQKKLFICSLHFDALPQKKLSTPLDAKISAGTTRQLNSSDSIGKEMTHFKPIRNVPISAENM